jgi:hypothetical protein
LSPLAAAGRHGRELLGADWLGKWRRSDAQVPLGADVGDGSWYEAVMDHPQFRGCRPGALLPGMESSQRDS